MIKKFVPIVNTIPLNYKTFLTEHFIAKPHLLLDRKFSACFFFSGIIFKKTLTRYKNKESSTKSFIDSLLLGNVNRINVIRYCSSEFDVIELSGTNFLDYVQQKKQLFVFFYDPFCPHCKKAEPEFLKAARHTSVPCARVDGPENEGLCRFLGVNAFPCFRYFVSNGAVRSIEFKGEKTAAEFNQFINGVSQTFKASNMYNSARNYSTLTQQMCEKIVLITTSNLRVTLLRKSALILFYSNENSESEIILKQFNESVCRITDDNGAFGLCNTMDNPDVVQQLGIKTVPVIKYFQKGGQYIQDFKMVPKTENILTFLEEMKARRTPDVVPPIDIINTKVTYAEKAYLWQGVDGRESIIHITNDNLAEVLKKYASVLIFFYACWNKACCQLKNVYVNAGKKLDGNIGILAACDAEENTEIADQFLISRFPTFKYFRDGQYLTDFSGEITEQNLLKFMQDPGKQHYTKKENKIVLNYSKRAVTGSIPPYWHNVIGAESLIFVNDYNYKAILNTYSTILIMFYVSWCKACSIMKEEYGKSALEMTRQSRCAIAACDAEENNFVADSFLVTKLPTLKLFKDGKYVEDYIGKRTAHDIACYVKESSLHSGLTIRELHLKQRGNTIANLTDMLLFWNDVEGGNNVTLINENNFKRMMDQCLTVLIMFYHPIVSEMENVKKEFALAAKSLHKEYGKLGAYQCSASDNICRLYEISFEDLPAFKLFKNGRFNKNYVDPKTAESFLKFMQGAATPRKEKTTQLTNNQL